MFISKKVGSTLLLVSILAACSSTPKQPTTSAEMPVVGGTENADLDLEKLAKERAAQGLVAKKDENKEKNTVAADSSKEPALTDVNAELKAIAAPVLNDYQRAVTLMKANQLDEAYALFEDIQTKAPQLAGPALNQALIRIQQQNYKDADSLLQKAITANSKNPFAYNLQGFVYRQLGQFSKSRAAYEQALTLSPNYAKAHFNLGVLADLYLQDLPLALQHYEAYQNTQSSPDSTVAKWVIDLQKRTGTYKPPAKKAKVEEITVEEAPTPAVTEAVPVATEATSTPSETTPAKTDGEKPVENTPQPQNNEATSVVTTPAENKSNTETAPAPSSNTEANTTTNTEAANPTPDASKSIKNTKEKGKKAKKDKKQADNVTSSTATSSQEAVKSAPVETNAETIPTTATGVQQP